MVFHLCIVFYCHEVLSPDVYVLDDPIDDVSYSEMKSVMAMYN